MLIQVEELPDFKKWAIQKLEQGNKTDADADVLADYIIALLNADEPPLVVRGNLESNLKDFVHHGAAEFSDEIMRAVDLKLYKPGKSNSVTDSSIPTSTTTNTNGQDQAAAGSVSERPQGIQTQRDTRFRNQNTNQPPNNRYAGGSSQSRKRTYYDRDTPEHFSSRMSPMDERAKKAPRRGGRGNSRGRSQQQSNAYSPSMPAAYPALQYHPGSNPSDHVGGNQYYGNNGPMDASGFLGGDQTSSSAYSPSLNSSQYPRSRCRDYDSKGYCTKGADCPFDHSDNPAPPQINPAAGLELITQHVMRNPGAFSPARLANLFGAMAKAVGEGATSSYSSSPSSNPFESNSSGRSRFKNRNRGGDNNNRGGRSNFSLVGAPQSRTNTTLVVENIPKEHYLESEIRDYFEQFGEIVKVMLPSEMDRSVALLEFADREAAEKAWHSPDAVFGNRFVKVFWSKDGDEGANSSSKKARENHKKQNARFSRNAGKNDYSENQESQADETEIEPMEIEQRIADAQKLHEEKLRKAAEAKEKLSEVEERLKAKDEEKKKLLAMIAAKEKKKKNGEIDLNEMEEIANGPEEEKDSHENEINSADEELKARLKMLEAEAQSLGIDPNRPFPFSSFRGRGRGAIRGRGRGSYRGAFGSFRGGAAPGAVMRLDNRPKKIALIGVKVGTQADEAVRRFLLNKFENHNIEPHPERDDSQVISFAERYMAELFLEGAPRELNPEVGKLELKWFTGSVSSMATSGPTPISSGTEPVAKETTDAAANRNQEDIKSNNQLIDTDNHDRDLDVADDEDRWMN